MNTALTTIAPISFSDLEKMGAAIAKSGLFGLKTTEQAVALMLVAQSEGLHPAIAARDYHVIQGRPALRADAMLARFQASGGRVSFTQHTDERVAATFTHPQGGTLEVEWDMARAKKAGLGGKDMWVKFPRQMLRARVISEGVRSLFPGCVGGFYTPEEVRDFVPVEKDIGSGSTVTPTATTVEPPVTTQEAPRRGRAPKRDQSYKNPPHFVSDPSEGNLDDVLPLNSSKAAVNKTTGEINIPSFTDSGTGEQVDPNAFISDDRCDKIADLLFDNSIEIGRLLKAANVDAVQHIKNSDYAKALNWIDRVIAKQAAETPQQAPAEL
jgi:hypothetical protein